MRKIRKIFISLLMLCSAAFVALCIPNIQKRIEEERELQRVRDEFERTVKYGMLVMTEEEYMESLKNVPSDIKSMSQYDKYMMGLEIADGSDTDEDGLTDKEEIESYGSDPLKQSTAGDLYTDGYKAERGMDLFTYYEYKEPIVFPYNECNEVILQATIPSDLYAVVEDVTKAQESLAKYNIIAAYGIYNYSGILAIDVNALKEKSEKNFNIKKVKILIAKGDLLTKAEYTQNSGTYVLKGDFDKDYEYVIYVITNCN